MNNILYYPYINIPPTDWTMRTLMYYDTVGTIVPHSYLHDINSYEPFTKKLIKEGLIEPISPVERLTNSSSVMREFRNYLESDEVDIKKRLKNFRKGASGRIHPGKFGNDLSRIHRGKFDHELFYFLMHAGIAKRNNNWFEVESKTANELMTFIASVIGVKLNYLPTTDQLSKKSFRAIGLKKKDISAFKIEQNKRQIILQNLIPSPGTVDLKILRKFKDSNFALLKRFKNRVEDIALDRSIDPDSDLFRNKIEDLKDQKSELASRMNESRLRPMLINAAGIVAAISGMQSDSVAGKTAGLIGFGGAILQAINIEKRRNTIDQTGLKYLVLAERTLTKTTNTFFEF